ncbi:MAG: hypothetical protein RR292_04030, partial [Christensenellaceae bacterium]
MKVQKKLFSKGRRTFAMILSAFVLICVLLGAACFQYYAQLQKTVNEESSGYLQEISKLLGDNTSRIINDNFTMLNTMSMVLKNSDIKSFEQLGTISLDQSDSLEYDNIYLV